MKASEFTLLTTKSRSPSLSKSPYAEPLLKLGWFKPQPNLLSEKVKSPLFLNTEFVTALEGIKSIKSVITSFPSLNI